MARFTRGATDQPTLDPMARREARRLLDRDIALGKYIQWCYDNNRDTQDRATLDAYCETMGIGRIEGRRMADGAAALALILRGETRESLALSLLGAVQTGRRQAAADGDWRDSRQWASLEADLLGLRSSTVRLIGDRTETAQRDPTELTDAELLAAVEGEGAGEAGDGYDDDEPRPEDF